jgi:hypothetical protein
MSIVILRCVGRKKYGKTLLTCGKYRIVRTAMNIKQKANLSFGLILLAGLLTLAFPSSASALSKNEFVSVICAEQRADPDDNGANVKFCEADASNGEVERYGKTIKLSDHKGKSKKEFSNYFANLKKKSETADTGSGGVDNPIAGDDCGGVKTAIIKCNADNSGDIEDNGIWALLLMVLNILTAGVGIIAVGGIVYGSILYTTAENKADQVKKATDIITNVVIGLILFALMWAGLNFIVPGGVFA